MFPRITLDIPVREARPLESCRTVRSAIERAKSALASSGRVVVRYSETEPLVRVTVEAEQGDVVRRHSEKIAAAIEAAVGLRTMR